MGADRQRPPQGAPAAAGDDRDDRRSGQPPPEPPPLEGDFAEEHTSPTFADQSPGGLERQRESESPEGYGGMDSAAVDRPHRDGRGD